MHFMWVFRNPSQGARQEGLRPSLWGHPGCSCPGCKARIPPDPSQEEGCVARGNSEETGRCRGETQGGSVLPWIVATEACMILFLIFISTSLPDRFSEPWSRGSEALSWEARAWKGSATESYGGKQQLQQDGRGEAQSEDGGQQREPHSTNGSNEWEIQGEGLCLSKFTKLHTFHQAFGNLLLLLFYRTRSWKRCERTRKPKRDLRTESWEMGHCTGFFTYPKIDLFFVWPVFLLCSLPTFLK